MTTDEIDAEPDGGPEELDSDPKAKRGGRLNLTFDRWTVAGIGAGGVVLAAIAVFFIARGMLDGPHEPPVETPPIYDEARLMTPIQRKFLGTFHGYLLDDFDIDYRVVTVKGAADIDRYAIERFENLFPTSRDGDGHGLLLVVDPVLDRVRLEVAFALESDFSDTFIAYMETRQMAPFFRTKRIADGIIASTELIIDRAKRAAATAALNAEAKSKPSPASPETARQMPRPARTPAQALQAYIEAMNTRNTDPDLPFYTPGTREMLYGQTITRAQMDAIVKTHRRCRAEPRMTSPDGQFVVLRYPLAQPACAPFFFQKIDGDWALDLATLQQVIRSGRNNAWHFDPGVDHPYRFAFVDWRFDKKGFPAGTR